MIPDGMLLHLSDFLGTTGKESSKQSRAQELEPRFDFIYFTAKYNFLYIDRRCKGQSFFLAIALAV